MDANATVDMLTVLQSVDQFYATSWNHLLICGSVAIGIVGVVIPLMLQIYQRRAMRLEKSEIHAAIISQIEKELVEARQEDKKVLEEKIAAAIKTLEERLSRDRAELEEGVRKLESTLRKGIAGVNGGALHVQTNAMLTDNNYAMAFRSAVDGLSWYVDADDHSNMRSLFKVLTKGCLPHMTKAQMDEMEDDKKVFGDVMKKITEWDAKQDFSDALKEAKVALKAASERVPVVKASGS